MPGVAGSELNEATAGCATGAVEVMIGGTPTREFDVAAATADEALSSVRGLLAPYL